MSNHAGQFEQLCELVINFGRDFEASRADGVIDAAEQAQLEADWRAIEGHAEGAAHSVAVACQVLHIGAERAPSRRLRARGEQIRTVYGHKDAAKRCHALRR